MKDNLQGISFDRYLMRLKDIVLLLTSVASLIAAGYVAVIYVVRLNDKVTAMERELTRMRVELTNLKTNSNRQRNLGEWNEEK